jgi:GT2 family glycosyltransferase
LALFYQSIALVKDFLKNILPSRRAKSLCQIYAPHGAFIIFSRQYFLRGGSFKHPSFLYGEEITVAENCKKFGFQVLYDPGFRVLHFEHGSHGWIKNIINPQLIQFKHEFLAQHLKKMENS